MHAGAARIAALQACLRHAKASTSLAVFALRAGERYQIVRVQEIRWMEAAGSYVRLHLPQGLMIQHLRRHTPP